MKNLWMRFLARHAAQSVHARAYAGAGEVAVPKRATPAPVPHPSDDAATLAAEEVEDAFQRFVLGLPPGSPRDEPSQRELQTLKLLDELCGGDRFDAGTLPRLPAILPQLLRLLKSDDVAGGQLAKLVGRDPVLVGEVMRATRSVHYRTLKPVTSLQHAVVLLGQDGLQRVVAQHVMKPILQASAGMFGYTAGRRLWDHAERCAHATAFLSKGHGEPFEAYLAGVICRTGMSAVVRMLDQHAPPGLGAFSRQFLAGCAWLGSYLTLQAARHWELQEDVVEALRERMEVIETPPASPLGQALLAADRLAMLQLLGEQNLLDPEARLAISEVPGALPPSLLAHCQQDLRHHFRAA